LWVFANDEISLYVIDPSRVPEVVEAIPGTDYAGVLICDCCLAYDPLTCARNKCVGHLPRRCKKLQEMKSGRTVQFTRDLARLLRAAMTLKLLCKKLIEHGYRVACGQLEAALDRL
jgi:hypothetical protein